MPLLAKFLIISHNLATYFVEVHVHALQLEVRGAIVAIWNEHRVRGIRKPTTQGIYHLHTRAIKAVLARDGLPVELSV